MIGRSTHQLPGRKHHHRHVMMGELQRHVRKSLIRKLLQRSCKKMIDPLQINLCKVYSSRRHALLQQFWAYTPAGPKGREGRHGGIGRHGSEMGMGRGGVMNVALPYPKRFLRWVRAIPTRPLPGGKGHRSIASPIHSRRSDRRMANRHSRP